MATTHRRPAPPEALAPRAGRFIPSRAALAMLVLALGMGLWLWLASAERPRPLALQLDRAAFSPDSGAVTALYRLDGGMTLWATVTDGEGRLVRRLVDGEGQRSGSHALPWDGRDDEGARLPDGTYRLALRATGGERQLAETIVITLDSVAPLLSVALPERLTTRHRTLAVEGESEPNATLWLGGVASAIADARGHFRADYALVEGATTVVIRAVDAAGNETITMSEVTLRTRPPALRLSAPGESRTVVGSTLVTVRGGVPPDVNVTINGREAPVNRRGDFALPILLAEGPNVLRIVASDPVGNTSRVERRLTLRSLGPTLALDLPDSLTVSESALTLRGETAAGSRLSVNGRRAEVDEAGRFETEIRLREGENRLLVTARGADGHATTVERVVTLVPPGSPLPAAAGPTRLPTIPSVELLRWLLGGSAMLVAGAAVRRRASSLDVSLAVDNPIFCPTRPDGPRHLVARVALSRAAQVEVEVVDAFGRPVRLLVIGRRQRRGERFLLWDGRSASGRPLPGGSYLIRVRARTPLSRAVAQRWVRLDTPRVAPPL